MTINKQQKSKDKSQFLKGPPRLYKPFYLLFTSSALPSFARNDILLIYFFYYFGQEVYKLIFISPGRVSILYPVGISRFVYNTSAVYHGRQTTLKPNIHATGHLVTEWVTNLWREIVLMTPGNTLKWAPKQSFACRGWVHSLFFESLLTWEKCSSFLLPQNEWETSNQNRNSIQLRKTDKQTKKKQQ